MKYSKPDMKVLLREKFQNYIDTSKARVSQLFENHTIRDFIFETFGSGNI